MNRFLPLAAVFVVALTLTACSSSHDSDQGDADTRPAAAVLVQAAENKSRSTTEEVVGTVQAKHRAVLEPKLSGRITSLPVILGQHVKSGELVARLDTAEIKARLDQAEASLDQAQRHWNRTSALFGQQAATHAEYDAAQTGYSQARAVAAEAKAMMSYTEILAPFDGVVTNKWAHEGDFAAPGKPLISMEDPLTLQVEADVPQAIAAQVAVDTRLTVGLDGAGAALTGIVSEVASAGDPLTRTVRIKVDLPTQPGLSSGQFARLFVPVGESQSLRVPAAAVVQRGQLEIVFVVSNRIAQLRLVKTGKRIDDEWEILSGLDAGDLVVVEGASQLTDGQTVAVK